MLTVVSLAAENRVIKYETLLKSLGLSDTRTLEDILIEGMYVGLFSGKLDQKRQEFQVNDISYDASRRAHTTPVHRELVELWERKIVACVPGH